MLRRLALILSVGMLAAFGLSESAFAHIPFGSPDNPQWGCITTGDPWTGANSPGFGPFNSDLVVEAAPDNDCGQN